LTMDTLHMMRFAYCIFGAMVIIGGVALCAVLLFAYSPAGTHPKCRLCGKQYWHVGTAGQTRRKAPKIPAGTKGSVDHLNWLGGGACSACYDARSLTDRWADRVKSD
jgi:hypothetical protein